MAHLSCWNCGESLDDLPLPISRHANCPKCYTEVHCCRMCRHYDPRVTDQCAEDRAEPPLNKEVANFCDWFEPATGTFESQRTTKQDHARAELEALFGKRPGSPPASEADAGTQEPADDTPPKPLSKEEEARARLDALFKK
jgi:hypothetical protein